MSGRLGLAVAIVLAGVLPATAADRPLFEFQGDLPVPGGTVRLEARCVEGADGFHCRAGTRAPSGRGFQFEGRFGLTPPAPPEVEKTGPARDAPRWF